MNTPAYFCMDNLGGVRPETEDERNVRVGDSNIALADLFNLETDGATVKYALEESLSLSTATQSASTQQQVPRK